MSSAVLIEAPAVRSFDARTAGLDERGLRQWVRAWSTGIEAAYVSRSYCHPHAVVAWHTESVGVDIERVTACEKAFAESICSPSERLELGAVDGTKLTSVWSSKEALAKALGDAVDYDPRLLESPILWPDGESGAWRAMKIEAPPSHVAWVCWRVADPRGADVCLRGSAVSGRAQLGSRGPCSRRATSSSSRSSSRPRVTASSSEAQ